MISGPFALRVSAGILCALTAWGARALLEPLLGTSYAYLTFYPAVAIAAFLLGAWPGITCTVVSAVIANLWYTPPVGSLSVASREITAMAVFGLSGVLLSLLGAEAARTHRMRHELRDLLSRHRLALEAAQLGWWQYNPRAKTSVRDSRFLEIFGLESGAGPNEETLSLIHSEDRPRVWAAVEAALNPGDPKPFSIEYRIRRPDGQELWIEAHGVATFQGDGSSRRAVNFVGTVADITARKEAEEALRRERERLGVALRGARLGVYEWRVGEPTVWWSPETYALYGVDPATFTPTIESFSTVVHPDDRDELWRRTRESIERCTDFAHEYRIVRPDGEVRWVYNHSQVACGPDGKAERVIGVAADITERMRVGDSLRESEERFRTMADGLPLIIWVHGPDGQQQFVNRTFCEFFGVTHEEMRGGRWQLLMHPEDAEAYTAEFLSCVAERRPFNASVRVRRADGQWRWIESWGRPRSSAGGEFLGFVGASADVTAAREATDAIRRINNELQRFASIASHDLKEPLRGVSLLAGLVQADEANISEQSRQRLARAQGLCAQLTTMVDGLLQYARSGGTRKDEVCELEDVIRRASEKLSPMLDHESTLTIEGPFPRVRGDALLLERAFGNLLANAYKHNPAATKRVVIRMEGGAVTVRDNGPGIDARHHERIFGLFSRVPGNDRQDGVGLGLALVKNIIESHGGTVGVSSELGAGAAFWVRLPFEPDSAGLA